MTLDRVPARVKRVNRGKGHSYTIDGEAAPGVTTILNDGCPKPALIGWAANTTAGWAVDNWQALEGMTPSKRLDALKRARFEVKDEASVRGTKVHDYAAQLAQGAEVDVPEAQLPLVDSYLQFVAQYRVQEVAVEAVVVNYEHRYCGTLDLLATLDDDPALWLIDWKTGASGVWPEAALQLAAYRNADALIVDGHELPMPEVHAAACVWLRPDGFDVYPVETGPAAFRTFLYVQQVAKFCNRERSDYVRDALPARALEDEGQPA